MSNDKIEEIRKRHEEGGIGKLPMAALAEAHDDRATLLAEVDRLRADVERLTGLSKQLAEGLGDEIRRFDDELLKNDRLDAENDRLLAENERLREGMQSAKADAWEDGYEAHRQMIEGIARKPSNPYR